MVRSKASVEVGKWRQHDLLMLLHYDISSIQLFYFLSRQKASLLSENYDAEEKFSAVHSKRKVYTNTSQAQHSIYG